MTNDSTNGTLEVKGFTPYAQVPRWIARSGKHLSLGAKSLYGAIMSYADNQTKFAFPGQQRLADDLGVSIRSVSTYIKELEAFGAMAVVRGGRNERTGNYHPNRYTLTFDDPRGTATLSPSEAHCSPPSEAGCTLTTPKVTTPSFFTSDKSDERKPFTSAVPADATEPAPRPFSLDEQTWTTLRNALRTAAATQDIDHLTDTLHERLDGIADGDLIDDLATKWTLSPRHTAPYAAGTKLTQMLNTLAKGWQ